MGGAWELWCTALSLSIYCTSLISLSISQRIWTTSTWRKSCPIVAFVPSWRGTRRASSCSTTAPTGYSPLNFKPFLVISAGASSPTHHSNLFPHLRDNVTESNFAVCVEKWRGGMRERVEGEQRTPVVVYLKNAQMSTNLQPPSLQVAARKAHSAKTDVRFLKVRAHAQRRHVRVNDNCPPIILKG